LLSFVIQETSLRKDSSNFQKNHIKDFKTCELKMRGHLPPPRVQAVKANKDMKLCCSMDGFKKNSCIRNAQQ